MVLRRRRCLGRVLHRGDAVLLSRLARALVLAALAVSPAAAQPRVETIATGLEVPWALAFAADGRLFVTERVGRIRVVKNGRLEPAPVATLSVAGVVARSPQPARPRVGWQAPPPGRRARAERARRGQPHRARAELRVA